MVIILYILFSMNHHFENLMVLFIFETFSKKYGNHLYILFSIICHLKTYLTYSTAMDDFNLNEFLFLFI